MIQRLRSLWHLAYCWKRGLLYELSRVHAKVTLGTKLGELDRLYIQMVDDLEKGDDLFKPSPFWQHQTKEFRRVLYAEGIRDFKGQYFNRRFAAYPLDSPRIYEALLWVYFNELKKRDTLKLLDHLTEPTLGGGDTFEIKGKRVSLDLLQSVDEFYSVYSGFKQLERQREHYLIAELGAGYGRLAYIFLRAIPNLTYVIFDLPESLILSQSYLSTLFSKEQIMPYDVSRSFQKHDRSNLKDYKIVFMLPWQLTQVSPKTFDVFCNTTASKKCYRNKSRTTSR